MATAFSFEACCTSLVGDVARALSERKGDTPEQSLLRGQAIVHMIMGLLPRDVSEVILASHCVMFHELMVAGLHDAFCADNAKVRRAERHGLIALNKAFCSNLSQLQRYQKRVPEGSPTTAATSETTAERATSAGPDQVPVSAGTAAVVSAAEKQSTLHRANQAVVAARRNHPAAPAPRNAGDQQGFTGAMGTAQPTAASLAAAPAAESRFDPGTSGPRREATLPINPPP